MSYTVQVSGHGTHEEENELHKEIKHVLSKPKHAAHISHAIFGGTHVTDPHLHHPSAAEAEAAEEAAEERAEESNELD